MRIIRLNEKTKENDCFGATTEMIEWYEKRTKKHIQLVAKYCKKLAEQDESFQELIKRSKTHDDSKFEEPERSAYVWTTWKYKCKDDGKDFNDFNPPEDIDDLMNAATLHHVISNSHHPEYHSPDQENVINKKNRDKPPEKTVDATKMPKMDIAEMCCDWCAVSEEKGNSPFTWADNNVGKRWNFTEDQTELIYNILDKLWES